MIDPSLMPELPVMPNPKLHPPGTYPDGVLTYSADQMNAYAKAYGLQCLERAAQECDQQCESWSLNCHCATAIRALALQEKTNG